MCFHGLTLTGRSKTCFHGLTPAGRPETCFHRLTLAGRSAVDAFICFSLVTFTGEPLQRRSESGAKHTFKNYVIIYEYYKPAINIYLAVTEAKPR